MRLLPIPPDALVVVDEIYYKQQPLVTPEVGMLVLDLHDGSYGYIDTISDSGRVSVRDKWAVEVGIKIERLRLLTPTINPNSVN